MRRDLNPYRFQAPWGAFEFGTHVVNVNASLVILNMAWLLNPDPSDLTMTSAHPDWDAPHWDTLSYWVARLTPLLQKKAVSEGASTREIIVIICNRTGTEGSAMYAGTSTVLGFKDGRVRIFDVAGRRDSTKGLLVDTTAESQKWAVTFRTPPDRSV